MIAEKGYVRRPYIAGNLREKITVYGSISSNLQWTWSWGSDPTNIVSGYKQTEQIYDKNLTYYPPPSFPTTGSYAIFSWEEL